VIRGTDFEPIARGRYTAVPTRYENERTAQRRLLRAGDILLEISGGSRASEQPTGRSLFVTSALLEALGGSVIPASFCRLIRVDKSVARPRYAYYALQEMYRSGRARLYEQQSTGISNFQFAYFADEEQVWVPNDGTQRAIAGVLGAFDEKIELSRKMSQTLEAMARALFQSWFVDFDPVRAKAEGRDPGLPPRLADLFPDSFQDSKLGRIPFGWGPGEIGDLAVVAGGSTPSTKEPSYWEGGRHCWATPKDLAPLKSPILINTERRITDEGLAKISSGLLPRGTVLLSSRAPIGYLAVTEIPAAINQGFIAIQPKKGVSNLFLLFWAESARDAILSRANGSTFLEISKSNFRPISAISPPAPVMRAFDASLRPLYEKMVMNERESRTLTGIRDELLPRLISGELRVQLDRWSSEEEH